VHQVGFNTRIYRDARSTKHKVSAKNDSTALNCMRALKYYTFYGMTDFRKLTFCVTRIWRALFVGSHQHQSTGYNSIGMVHVYRKMWHFMMAGCSHQVVEHIIRSSQCLSVIDRSVTTNTQSGCTWLLPASLHNTTNVLLSVPPSSATCDGVYFTSLLLLSDYSIPSVRSVF
jgi:hypothetical protein